MRGENFFEREFTLAARACIAALGKVEKRRGNIKSGRIGAGKAARHGLCSPYSIAAADARFSAPAKSSCTRVPSVRGIEPCPELPEHPLLKGRGKESYPGRDGACPALTLPSRISIFISEDHGCGTFEHCSALHADKSRTP